MADNYLANPNAKPGSANTCNLTPYFPGAENSSTSKPLKNQNISGSQSNFNGNNGNNGNKQANYNMNYGGLNIPAGGSQTMGNFSGMSQGNMLTPNMGGFNASNMNMNMNMMNNMMNMNMNMMNANMNNNMNTNMTNPQTQSTNSFNQNWNSSQNESSQKYENNGPNYTNMAGDYNSKAGYRGRGSNRGGSQNFGRTFDSRGRANTGHNERQPGRGSRGSSNSRGSRGSSRGYDKMPVSRGGHHRNLMRENEGCINQEDEHLPNQLEEDALFRPKIINERQREFMDRKREGTKTAAQQALAKVKARKMLWRSQRKIVEEKEQLEQQQREGAQKKESQEEDNPGTQEDESQGDSQKKKLEDDQSTLVESTNLSHKNNKEKPSDSENFSDPDEAENYYNAKSSIEEKNQENDTGENDDQENYERTNKFYVKKASLNPFGGNMGDKFEYIHDKDLVERIKKQEAEKDKLEKEALVKAQQVKKTTTKLGMRVAPNYRSYSTASASISSKNASGLSRPKFTLNDPHIKKANASLMAGRLVRNYTNKDDKKFEDATYLGIQPIKPKHVREKEEREKLEQEKLRLAEEEANRDPRENLVYKDKASENCKKNIVNTALPQPKIISSTSDYYEQAVTSLSGDKARQLKFQKLMGMGKKRPQEKEKALTGNSSSQDDNNDPEHQSKSAKVSTLEGDDSATKEPTNFRRTYDPTKVTETLEEQFNTLRGGKSYFDN